jgi:hypothetical protein
MEAWNREQLYAEIWENPLVKLAAKYGISAVALGKVCRKLQIPLPGRGYWVKKEFGKAVVHLPLPEAQNLPVVHRMKQVSDNGDTGTKTVTASGTNPEDPELARIAAVEAENLFVEQDVKFHKLISMAGKILRHSRADERGIVRAPHNEACLDIRVSKSMLNRALAFMNAIILRLESEGFSVGVKTGSEGTAVEIFGQRVSFALLERARVKARREVKEYSWTRTITDYEPTGELEFRVLEYGQGLRKTWSDGKTHKLEYWLNRCIGALMREGRFLRIRQERFKRQKKQQEMAKLAALIREEEEKISDLDKWVTAWFRAEQIRGFVAALERVWTQEGHDLSPEAPKGQRIAWMRQQAERLDPMVPSPPSVLDRKGEVCRW